MAGGPESQDRPAMWKAAGIIGLAALVIMAPVLIHGAPASDSGAYNYIWTQQIAAEMARGVAYPRWLPQSFEGLGAPTFYFYPPLAYLLAGALAMVMETRHALGVAAFVMLYASGLAMYAWLRPRSRWAVLGACLYMLAPYHLRDFYARSALAEFGAFVWLPLIALAIERQKSRWGPPLLAAAFAGLICTHLPTALLASAILIPPLVFLSARKEPPIAVSCALAGLAGMALSGLYLVPALMLQKYTLLDQLMWAYRFTPEHNSIVTFFQGQGHLPLAIMMLLAAEWAVIAAVAWREGAGRTWPLLTLWAAACAVGIIPLVWLPVLAKVQFPWRALAIAEFAGVTALTLVFPRRLALLVAAAIAVQALSPVGEAALGGLEEGVNPAMVARHADAVEYLPAELRPVPQSRASPDLSALAGPLVRGPARLVETREDGSVTMTATGDGAVVVRRAKFPSWRVMSNGAQTPLGAGPLVSFQARAGQTYRLFAVRTSAETTGGWLSLAGALCLLLLWLLPLRRRPGLS
jgi:uncharacterized membrane protein